MFTAEDVQMRIKKQPFTPVRIITSSGEHYDLHHPDLAMVGKRLVVVGAASTDNPTVFDRYSLVSILHITAMEYLPVSAAPPASEQNGK